MLVDQFTVLHLKISFKITDIARYPDLIDLKLDGFDQVISYIHHQFHGGGLGYKETSFWFLIQPKKYSFFESNFTFLPGLFIVKDIVGDDKYTVTKNQLS